MAEEAAKKAKKVNLRDHHAIKRLLDEAVIEIVLRRGYREKNTIDNLKMGLGVLACAVALVAQFYPKKFPDNKPILAVCIGLYVLLNLAIQLVIHLYEKDHILFAHPPRESFTATGLAVSSKLPQLSDKYTLRIASAEPNHISAHPPAELVKSVTKWVSEDGILVESIFAADVQKLLDKYEEEPPKETRKKSK